MAKGTVEYGALPFKEAIAFFRQKLSMPSEHFNDLWKDMHAKGFMVAGVMKAELLTDLRGAVDKIISAGGTLAEFRKNFDSIVEQHGWLFKGGRNWRTKVIYNTNLRQSNNAGRYQQMTEPEVLKLRPYWRYRHSGSANPRESHLALNGLVLPHDDPFWDTYYPQNGWGCNCGVDNLSKRDLARIGKTGPDTAPEIKYREYVDRNGNKHQVPEGIDPGFNYNVGKAAEKSYKILAERFETLPYDIAKPFMAEFVAGPAFEQFHAGKIKGEFPVAMLSESDKTALGSQAQTVWISQTTLAEHKASHPEISLEDYRLIPEIIETGEVYKQGATRLIFLKKDGRLYRAALKRTGDRKENYFLTLFEIDEGRGNRQVRNKYERIR